MKLDLIASLFAILKGKDKRVLLKLTLVQTFVNFFDLIGVGLAGYFATSAIQVSRSLPIAGSSSSLFRYFHLDAIGPKFQIIVIGMIVILFLVSKSLISIVISKKILRFFSNQSTNITLELIKKIMSQPLLKIKSKNMEENIHALTYGVDALTLGVFSSLVMIFSDLTLLITLFTGLVIISFFGSIALILFFGVVGVGLYSLLSNKTKDLTREYVEMITRNESQISDLLNGYREIKVSNTTDFFIESISKTRKRISNSKAEINFLPYIGKYVLEISIITGGMMLITTQLFLSDSVKAAGSITIFMVASSRIAPAVLRLQQNFLLIRGNLEISKLTLELKNNYDSVEFDVTSEIRQNLQFKPEVIFSEVNFKYQESDDLVIRDCSFQISPGEFIGLVGPSGAGKSTMVDLMLGIQKPLSGSIKISGQSPPEVFSLWPGQVAYVPQNPYIMNCSLSENISLGKTLLDISQKEIDEILAKFDLLDLADRLNNDGGHILRDNGQELSGGERQRIGLARALLPKPSLLILDEATSALDATTELKVFQQIRKYSGNTTVIMVTHKLSAIQTADRVFYVEKGNFTETKSIEEMKSLNENFTQQAKNSGL